MPKEKLGIDYASVLEDNFQDDDEIKEGAKLLGITPRRLKQLSNTESYNYQVEPELKEKIKQLYKNDWPSDEAVFSLAETYMSEGEFKRFAKNREEEQQKLWEKEDRQKKALKAKNKLHYKQIALLERKYRLPALKGKFAQSIRYNRIVDLSKDLSMHLTEIIAKYPQCKEIIFNAGESFWWNNEKKSIVEMAKIPQEDLKRDEKFNVFTKNEQQMLAGCSTAIIIIALLILAAF